MIALAFQAVLLSLDSLIVGFALGPLVQSQADRWRWASWFGICDGAAVLVGRAIGAVTWGPPVARAAPFLVLACGLYCLVAAYWDRFRADPRLGAVLPVLLSFDNFAFGLATGPGSAGVVASVLVLGLASSALAMLGLWLGQFTRSTNRRQTEGAAGFSLVLAGLLLLSVG